jgi:hypothetical protein
MRLAFVRSPRWRLNQLRPAHPFGESAAGPSLSRRAAAGQPAIRTPRINRSVDPLIAVAGPAPDRLARVRPWVSPARVRLPGVGVPGGTIHVQRRPAAPLAGIIPVLAVQGAGYVVAGLVMLVWLKEEPGEPASASAPSQGEPALAAADG